jgi:hypothetical protein
MIGRLIPAPWLAAGALATLVACSGASYLKGRSDGRAVVEGRLASDRVTILLDGREIDHETLGLDDTGLCAVLGGCGVPVETGGD